MKQNNYKNQPIVSQPAKERKVLYIKTYEITYLNISSQTLQVAFLIATHNNGNYRDHISLDNTQGDAITSYSKALHPPAHATAGADRNHTNTSVVTLRHHYL